MLRNEAFAFVSPITVILQFRLAAAELLAEAHRCAVLASFEGVSAWKRQANKKSKIVTKRFLNNTILSALHSNARQKRKAKKERE